MSTLEDMAISTVKTKHHLHNKEKTKTATFRLPENLLAELESEATQKEISQNVMVKQILEKFIRWDRFNDKIGMIPVPKGILTSLGISLESSDINMIVDVLKPIIKDNVLFMKGKYDLKRCIETLEDYMRASGMKSDHRVEGSLHHFIIQHGLGMNWSLLTEQLLKEIFHEFLPDTKVKAQTTKTTVIVTVSLGVDFNEHEY
ncbi:MAG: hypothetical protein OEW78_09105 [Nitrosopumilus sp.]|uniref:hypothetical protein n=1 Tax=Nitrosopumilus sp. TaxID=2024843 RepID=UPI00246A838C|nr:hypothetical protein [Nitrosopumilus sp.]MDH5432020.1 hypothetical protein [Nitrosopumilus sp.]